MYCTTAEVREVATQITETSEPTAWTDEVLNEVIERASRIFDQECAVEPGYFEESDGEVSTKTVYGDGTGLLRVPPYVAGSLNTTLVYPEGYSELEFTERGGYLVRTSSGVFISTMGGWYENVPITISAKWGYESTPADVKHAVIELVVNLCKETDPASIKLMSLDNQPLREKLPPRVLNVANKYRMRERVMA